MPLPLQGKVLGNIIAEKFLCSKNEIPNLQAIDKIYILDNKGEGPD